MKLSLKNPTIRYDDTGFVVWEGTSQIDGKTPIAIIATMRTENGKTGKMIQTWIVRRYGDPVKNVRMGWDYAICGRCPYRAGNGCYVNVGQAPLAVWTKYRAGGYRRVAPEALPLIGKGKLVRMGSYGDPTAAPLAVWESLVSQSRGRTGYTHQWKWLRSAKPFRRFIMASTDSPRERAEANRRRWRSFRVKSKGDPRERGEMNCPASVEMGKRVQCSSCLACNGTDSTRTLDVVIDVHGAKSKRVELYQLGLK